MKKLLLLLFLGVYELASAQTAESRHSVAIVAGPAWYKQFTKAIDQDAFSLRTGFTVGLDYAYRFAAHWQLTAGFRYNIWNWKHCSDLIFEDDLLDGPPYHPQHFCLNNQDKSGQYLLGIRWLGQPKIWRCYGGLDIGVTDYLEPAGIPKADLRFTMGGSAGLEWQPHRFGLFVQPTIRTIFQDFDADDFPGFHFLVPSVECGGRFHF